MGLSFSCPLGDLDDLDRHFEAVFVRSLSLDSGDVKTMLRSVSFNGHDSEPLETCGPRKLRFDGSRSRKSWELETSLSFRTPSANLENEFFASPMKSRKWDIFAEEFQRSNRSPLKRSSQRGKNQYQAALKLQKVYKSFRTRRKLADCAVLVEQRWWKLLDFAELKRSSISFFEIEKHETAISRWSRARTRAAKVGKGLSKDEKARKLALQHWLEAIDPRHRYGHNLQFYYVAWLHCDSKQPFFYWLDIGEGKEVNLERCPRLKLHQQCIKYLGPIERESYEVIGQQGKLVYKKSGVTLDTRRGLEDSKWIFVLSVSKNLYVGQKKKGTFQHSSFLAGGATLSAGRLIVEDGILKAVWPHSGHYLPTEENFQEFMTFLIENKIDLTNVKKTPDEEEREATTKAMSIRVKVKDADKEYSQFVDAETSPSSTQEPNGAKENDDTISKAKPEIPKSDFPVRFYSKLARLKIPNRGNVYDIFKTETLPKSYHVEVDPDTPEDGYETAEESFISEEEFMYPKSNLFDEDDDEDEKPVPKEKIMKRIDSHKGLKSYQLAQQLSSKWSTGAGPRISCMRDYPSELQFRVLEQAQLSPKGSATPKGCATTKRTKSTFA